MSLDQGTQEGIGETFLVVLDQLDFASEKVSFVLVNKLREVVNNFDNILCLDLVLKSQVIKEADKVADLAGENTTGFRADLDDLVLGELILAELAHVLLELVVFAAIEIGKIAEDVIDFLFVNLVVESEDELNFLDFLVQIFLTDQLRAVKEGLHCLLIGKSLNFQCLEELTDLSCRL